ncbi:MAG: membrane protein [Desulfatitalea sp. BRH_c12]|nr:MAG: membrane protein [Desulfatitalea sp. BRH_c12]
MEHYTELIGIISLALGAAWASGINLYAALLVLGLLGVTDNIALPENLQVLQNPIVIGAAGIMYLVEFFADKVPGVDTGWDTLHTFIRIPAGALLAAGAVGDVNPAVAIAAGILGGGMAAGSHATKAGSRVLINTSPEPFTNWTASAAEDVAVVAGLWTALYHPWVFVIFIVLFIGLLIWLLPKLWRSIMKIISAIGRMFGNPTPSSPEC